MVSERFVDANIFIRHFTADHETQSPAVRALFDRIAAKEESAWTSHLVLAEVAWVLTGQTYDYTRETVARRLTDFFQSGIVRIDALDLILETLNLFGSSNIGFMDSYHAALVRSQPVPELYSFDHDFDRIPGVRRIEP